MVEHDAARPTDAPTERARLQALLGAVEGHNGQDGTVRTRLQALSQVAVDALGLTGVVVSLMTPPPAGSPAGGAVSGAVVAASSGHARDVEELEFSTGEGPGMDAFLASRPVLTPDLETASSRWPAYAEAALAAGIGSTFAFPMHVGAVRLGVLHLHCSRPRTLTPREITTCLTLTDMATETVLGTVTPLAANELSEALLGGPGTRDQIYQAQGMVSVELRISLTDALARMRAHAFTTGRDLASLASGILSGQTPLSAHSDEQQ